MSSLSVCMIVKDEEPVMERSMKIVSRLADELIVADTGSKDRTREIAAAYTSKVYDYPWTDDFAAARNFSYSKATCDYIMWMDADDVILPEGIEKLRELMKNLPEDVDVIMLPYDTLPEEKDFIYRDYLIRDRIIRRSLNARWEYPIHEAIPLRAGWHILCRADIPVYHCKMVVNEKGRNLRIFEQKLAQGWQMDDFNKAYYCRELCTAGRYPEAAAVYEELLLETADPYILDYALSFYIESMAKQKRLPELKETLLSYRERCGENELLCCALGKCLMREQKWEEAEKQYQKALAMQSDVRDGKVHLRAYEELIPHLRLAKIRLHLGRLPQARADYLAAKALAPEDPQVKLLGLALDYQTRKNGGPSDGISQGTVTG